MAGRTTEKPLIAAKAVEDLIAAMARDIARLLAQGEGPVALVGIATGGVWLAERLQQRLPGKPLAGALDIGFYRDDYGHSGLHEVKPSRLPLSLENHRVVLVDDVLYTGRTVRAALNALFDLGRPERVWLAVLVDRGGRELPIAADVVGRTVEVPAGKNLRLTGPEPLEVRLEEQTA